ncbi:unnamed protein product [Didymodactylos carnosus]|uniref:Uncharacterized protein n=1 Tax=Didymodactylos carnosus TaxID=1234261 RepID=A0A814Q2Q9_9BILA|nr:unnamed protein product [Didymodactylos carnosus]CAF1476464.1 unnamed protein product [Didymodactylos carnosus]CAF3877815.1 unnamed protein product [Didymodactylos carnosus]CAF4267500.1 unnamed protein product [Didymodactylos carnosus]
MNTPCTSFENENRLHLFCSSFNFDQYPLNRLHSLSLIEIKFNELLHLSSRFHILLPKLQLLTIETHQPISVFQLNNLCTTTIFNRLALASLRICSLTFYHSNRVLVQNKIVESNIEILNIGYLCSVNNLLTILQCTKHLRRLSIALWEDADHYAGNINSISMVCSSLKYFHLNLAFDVSFQKLLNVFHYMPNLETLIIKGTFGDKHYIKGEESKHVFSTILTLLKRFSLNIETKQRQPLSIDVSDLSSRYFTDYWQQQNFNVHYQIDPSRSMLNVNGVPVRASHVKLVVDGRFIR